jgi:hypothetical protein
MTLLQIVPQVPGSFDGVGDYALGLAKALSANHGVETIFAVAKPTDIKEKQRFPVIAGLNSALDCDASYQHAVLHYANYGYQSRGVPFGLRNFARQLRGKIDGRWITMFHELYAFGPPWKSAFWLYPLQARIARDMIDISDTCFVSSDTIEKAIHAYDARKPARLVPIMSNFGEPASVNFDSKSPNRWVICGGNALILRSLCSFLAAHQMIPKRYVPEQLDVVGGYKNSAVRDSLRKLERMVPGISCRYHPEVIATTASEILRAGSFAWIDYFGKGKVWPGMIFKSGSFAACCAHGVVPILAHEEPPPALSGDPFPAWHFITSRSVRFPEPEQMGAVGEKIHAWYHRHASAKCTAQAYAEVLA